MLHPTSRLQERYQIVRLLGQGGMGAVYEAFDERLLVNVALKQTLQHGDILDRAFEREAQMLARLRHPMLPLVSDYFSEADGQFLVMQYIPGDDLATLLARQSAPFPLIDVLRWADQLLDTLTYLHTHQPPIVHRDIKPQNLKRTPDGSIVLLDFGLAKGLTGSDSTNAIHSLFGYTPQYAPLEQIHGTGTDSRSDLFALAATCYHLLTGVAPIDAVRRAAAVVAGQSDPLFITNTLWAGIPPAIAAVLTQGLALDPAQRPASATELRVLLHQASVAEITAVAVPDAVQIEKTAELRRQPQETRLRPNNLPVALTPIVGRTDEVRQAIEMLNQDSIRLLTLTGPGGTGKTRLSLEIASKASTVDEPSYWADGVFFVSLAPVRDPALILPAIAQVLEVRESGGQSLHDALIDFVREKRLLLVLDNFEQIVAAGPQLVDLLEGASHLKLLVTSREMLRLRGEHELPVSPLAHSAAVELFVQRARAVRLEFKLDEQNEHLIADICVRLDRLPLAIELAAARIRALTPQALLERLRNRLKLLTGGARDLPTRQQTLHNTIAWSYELLDAGEQLLFRRLSVFVGGRTLEAAEAVCNVAADLPIDVLDGIQSLLDKSLLYQQEGVNGEPRFMMLETIWEYAQEQLKASGEEDALRRAHADYYLALAEQAESYLTSSQQGLWLEILEIEHSNLRSTLEWAISQYQIEIGLRIGSALNRYWDVRSYIHEGIEWLEKFLALYTSKHLLIQANARKTLGNLKTIQGKYQIAIKHFEDALIVYESLNDKQGIANCIFGIGNIEHYNGSYQNAKIHLHESLIINRELGNLWGKASSLHILGNVHKDMGDYQNAVQFHEASLSIWQKIEDKRNIGVLLNDLGNTMSELGDYEKALELRHESLAIHRELNDKGGIARTLDNLANVLEDLGQSNEVLPLRMEALNLRREKGNRGDLAYSLHNIGCTYALRGELEYGLKFYKESISLQRKSIDRRLSIHSLEDMAEINLSLMQPYYSVHLFAAADALRLSTGVPLSEGKLIERTRLLENACEQLGDEAFATTWAEGHAMTLEQAIAYALEESA